jgi:hypothetical protein
LNKDHSCLSSPLINISLLSLSSVGAFAQLTTKM